MNRVVLWILFRSLVFAINIFYLNLMNGFSGQQPIESLIYLMITLNMTPFVIICYMLFEVQINTAKYSEREDKMPYSVSELYQRNRTSARGFYVRYAQYILFSFLTGFCIFIIYFFGVREGGILGPDGKTQDLYSYGVLAIMAFVLQHHIHVGINARNWSVPFVVLFSLSLLQLPLTYWWAEQLESSQLTHAVTTVLWRSPVFWVQLVLMVFVISLPILVAR